MDSGERRVVDNENVAEVVEFVFDSVENIVRKGENAGYLFSQSLLKAFTSASLKVTIVKDWYNTKLTL